MNQATMLCAPQITPLDRRLARLGTFLGIECRLEVVDGSATGPEAAADFLGREHHCLMVSANALGALLQGKGSDQLLQRVFDCAKYLFVYGFRQTAADASTVRRLSQGLVDSVIGFPHGDYQYAISPAWRCLTREFTGLTFGPIQPGVDAAFSRTAPSPDLRPIISIGGAPSFATFTRGRCTVFILACSDIADLEERVSGELPVAKWFSRIIPAAVFVRYAYGRRCWHGSRPSATFIIDDPLLRENYGFLNYRQLLRSTGDQRFAAAIAFIPFNYRRSQASVIELFRSQTDRLSLCVHGCDHTGGEFATTDLAALNRLAKVAGDRMTAKKNATGLPYDRVMVFPQGRFSSSSLQALRGNNYLAAVNTSPIPEDLGPGEELTVGEWLEVAVTRHHGFPLFARRYPGPLVGFAFDLFLGKPLLVVEHHTAFRDGYGELSSFVAGLNSLNSDLAWGSLGETLSRTGLRRELADDTVGARIWTNRHVIHNDAGRAMRYLVEKAEPSAASIRRVAVDDRPVDWVVEDARLRVTVDVPSRATRVVDIAYANTLPAVDVRVGLRTRLAIQARRRLSEFQANVLCRHERLLKRSRVAAPRDSQ